MTKIDFQNFKSDMKPDYVRPDSGGSEADFSRTCTGLRKHAVANLKKYTELANMIGR